jgi:enoyl reductase-like protein
VPRAEAEKADKEIERLTKILKNYALQYGTVKDQQKVIEQAKQEVAREIIQLIEEQMAEPKHHGYKDVRNDELAQLAIKILKKYIGE